MGKFKVVLTAILFIASCILLLGANGIASAVLGSYTPAYPSSLGAHTPAFSLTALTLMQNSAALCFGTLALSSVLALVAIRRSTSLEAKSYWVIVLAIVNYHVSAFLLGAMAVGFFLLPKLANGT